MADYTSIFTASATPNATKIPEKIFSLLIFFSSFLFFGAGNNTKLKSKQSKS